MSQTTNSGKKIQYCEGVLDTVNSISRKLSDTMGTAFTLSGNIRMAGVDRAYNTMVNLYNAMIEAMRVASKTIHTPVLSDLSTKRAVGEALITAAKKAMETAESVITSLETLEPISESTIASRGLDENWTPSTQAAFADVCATFMTLRKRFIDEVADITGMASEEDFRDVYQHIGVGLEGVANATVKEYNSLKDQLAAMNVMLQKDVDAAEAAAGSLNNIQVAHNTNIIGNDDY